MPLHHAYDYHDPSGIDSASIVNVDDDEDNTRCRGAAAAGDADVTGEDSGVRQGNPLSRDMRQSKPLSWFDSCLPPAISIHSMPHRTPDEWRDLLTVPKFAWLQQKHELELHCSKALMRVLVVGQERAAHMRTKPDPYEKMLAYRRINMQVSNPMRSEEEDSISSSEQEYQHEKHSASSFEEKYQHDAGWKRDRYEEGDDESLRTKKVQRLLSEWTNIGEEIVELAKGAEKGADVKEAVMMRMIEDFVGMRMSIHICKLSAAGFRLVGERDR